MFMSSEKSNKSFILWLIWLFEGIFVGFGAILPGISGGTLCVAFGMYRPLIETISHPKTGLKKYWLMLGFFMLGIAVGFVGLSGVAAILLEKNTILVTCAFAGFIAGTFPDLWQDAGSQGRNKFSIISLIVGFVAMIGILLLFKTKISVDVAPGIWGYLLCGLLWGFSFIIPGLSSSSLLLFFGLYQPMLEGISGLDFKVLIPMGIGMAACVLLLSKVMGLAYKKFFSTISHAVIGIVAATTVMILPAWNCNLQQGLIRVLFIVCGAAVSYLFTCLCNKLKEKVKTE